MTIDYTKLPRAIVNVNAQAVTGPCEAWRHSIGHGAINSQPLPERVVEGVRKLKSRLVRIFFQEYFNVYPDHGVFNWDKLDAYLDSFARTGAKMLATINLKPPVLYPHIALKSCRSELHRRFRRYQCLHRMLLNLREN